MNLSDQKKNPYPTFVLPGDDISLKVLPGGDTATNKRPKLGVGLSFRDDKVYATLSGRLEHNRSSHTWFVMQSTRRYVVADEDRVLGVVEDRAGSRGGGADLYRINIGGPHPAILCSLDFEGATKRNKPYFSTGDLVYARVVSTTDVMDPVLSCKVGPRDVGVPRKDWMTDEGLYGQLKGGTVQRISLGLARELMHPNCVVLEELAKHKLAFELCVGVNGFLWVHSERPEYTILIMNAVANSEVMTVPQVRGMVKALVATIKGQMQDEE